MKIVWDEPKRLATLDERGLDFASVTPDFFAAAKIYPVRDDRFVAIGELGKRKVAVIFKPLGIEALSVISLRPASRKERRLIT